MLQGRFGDTSGRPYMEVRLALPRLKISGDISLLFDTGADSSLLMPIDSGRLGIDFSDLTETTESRGIGGLNKQFLEPAILAFTDPGVCLHVYFLSLRKAAQTPDIADIPSILGRDIIDRWAISYDKMTVGLTAKVNHSDMQIMLSGEPAG